MINSYIKHINTEPENRKTQNTTTKEETTRLPVLHDKLLVHYTEYKELLSNMAAFSEAFL
jgi:hypothetical protein